MDFSYFFNHPDPVVRDMADRLAGYKTQLDNGSLTKAEYDDLVADATSLDDVSRAGKTIEELVMLDRAIALLKQIAGYVPLP